MTRYKQVVLISLASLLALAIIGSLFVNSPKRTLATPDLIQRAYDKGQITAEQRVLYLTYAIYEYESLPGGYRGQVPWEGTFILMDVSVAIHSPSTFCYMSPHTQSELRRLLRVETVCD